MSSCTDPETGELASNACDDCRGLNMSHNERREVSRSKVKRQNAAEDRARLLKRRKLERQHRKAAR